PRSRTPPRRTSASSAARAPRSTLMFVAAACAIAVSCYGRSAPVSAWISDAAPKVAEWGRVWFDDAR
ncbi:phosphoesterase, partial [Burkholderia mallei]|nr:phosphoesterase [Burkholderia mallei]